MQAHTHTHTYIRTKSVQNAEQQAPAPWCDCTAKVEND